MVGHRRLANDHDFVDDDDSAYLQQHTRNSAALERKARGAAFGHDDVHLNESQATASKRARI